VHTSHFIEMRVSLHAASLRASVSEQSGAGHVAAAKRVALCVTAAAGT
jgi:hypothetical protein